MTPPPRIYLSPPHLGEEEFEFTRQAFESNWISSVGPNLDHFEEELAGYAGTSHAVALSSGTGALHLGLIACGVGPGDEVLCSSFTFAASANAIRYVGALPVFIDSDMDSWNMDPGLCVAEIQRLVEAGKPPAAVMPVHLYGQSADMKPVLEACRRHAIPVVEDAAEALGATYRGSMCGAVGDVGVFSFNGNKIITTSGGGALVTNDVRIAKRVRSLSTQAKVPTEDNHYLHEEIGFNYRLSNVLAGIGRGQLRALPDRIRSRRRNFEHYQAELGSLPGISFMPIADFGTPNFWLTCIRVDPGGTGGVTRRDVQAGLEAENIESRPLWRPMHTQPAFADFRVVGGAVCEALFADGLALPSGSALTDEDLGRICRVVRQALSSSEGADS